MKFGIIVDSSCDLRELRDAESLLHFQKVPLTLRIGEQEFVDDNSLDISAFMTQMEQYQGPTGSAAPSPSSWCDAFQSAEEIFAFTISSNLSASYSSAITAKNMIAEQNPNKKIHIFDSKSTGPEISLLVLRIKDWIARGLEFEEIVEKTTAFQKHIHLFFLLESMDNLIKNGRLSKWQGNMAKILGIKLLGCASAEGTLEVLQKSRKKAAIYDSLLQNILSRGYKGSNMIITHCFNPEKAQFVKEQLLSSFPDSSITVMPTGGLDSYYAERGGLIIAFED